MERRGKGFEALRAMGRASPAGCAGGDAHNPSQDHSTVYGRGGFENAYRTKRKTGSSWVGLVQPCIISEP